MNNIVLLQIFKIFNLEQVFFIDINQKKKFSWTKIYKINFVKIYIPSLNISISCTFLFRFLGYFEKYMIRIF